MAAKKSKAQKGYRKYEEKKPYLSKKEIIALIVIVCAIILGVVLFNVFYSDGSLKVKNGVVQAEGENSLIFNAGSASAPRYFKVGQAAEVEGYELTSEPVSATDENVRTYIYTPVDESSPIDRISVSASASTAERSAGYITEWFSVYPQYETSEVSSQPYGDRTLYTVSYRYVETEAADAAEEVTDAAAETTEEVTGAVEEAVEETTEAVEETTEEVAETVEEATEEVTDTVEETTEEVTEAAEEVAETVEEAADEAADTVEEAAEETTEETVEESPFSQSLTGYLTAGDRSIYFHVLNSTESAEEYLPDDELMAALMEILPAISFETK